MRMVNCSSDPFQEKIFNSSSLSFHSWIYFYFHWKRYLKASVTVLFEGAPHSSKNTNFYSSEMAQSTVIKNEKKINIKCKKKQTNVVNIKTTSSYESTLQESSEHLGTKKRSRKSTNKMNVICKRARIEKIARRKYPKTLKEWENKLLKPLPAVSDQSLFWGGVLLPKMVRKESIRKRKISHIANRESRNCGWMRERDNGKAHRIRRHTRYEMMPRIKISISSK